MGYFTPMRKALLLVLLLASVCPALAVDRESFLRAIAEVETGSNPASIGRHGERGLFQFRKAVWAQHTSAPFTRAHHPDTSWSIARIHFDWVYAYLSSKGVPPTVQSMAMAWNAGVGATVRRQIGPATKDYAQRVAALVEDDQRRSAVIAAEPPRRYGSPAQDGIAEPIVRFVIIPANSGVDGS